MRIGKALIVMNENLHLLKIDADFHRVKNLHSIRTALQHLSEIPFLKVQASRVLALAPWANEDDTIELSSTSFDLLTRSLNNLRARILAISEAIDGIYDQDGSSAAAIHFRIPDDLKSLSELNKFISETDKAFELLFGSLDENFSLNFEGFEKGSNWLELLVPIGSIGLIVPTMHSILSLVQKYMELEKQHLMLQDLEADVTFKQQFRENQNHVMKLLRNSLAKKLAGPHDDSVETNNKILRITEGIKKFEDLITKGATLEIDRSIHNQSSINQQIYELELLAKMIDSNKEGLTQIQAPAVADTEE